MTTGKLILPLLAGALALGACDDTGTTTEAGSSDARLSILLTDAPGDFRTAVVTITDVYLQPSEGEDAERVYLRQDEELTVDLLTLQNEVRELVDDEPIPEGRYEQLRLVITGGYIEVEEADGGTALYASSPDYEGLPIGAEVDGELKMPSFANSGLKVLLSGGTDEEDDGDLFVSGDQTLIVDFDVSQSFGKQAGRSGKWVMRPVIKATSVQSAASLFVTLSLAEGVVLPPLAEAALTLADFEVQLTPVEEGDVSSATFADEDGDGVYEAEFHYLRPGDYRIGLVGPGGIVFETEEELPFAVTVDSGASATVALTLISALLAE